MAQHGIYVSPKNQNTIERCGCIAVENVLNL